MKEIDTTTLMAYLDGELDIETSRQVEAALARDAKLEEAVRRYRQSDSLVRAALNHVMFERADPLVLPERPEARQWRPVPAAIAASLVGLLIGGVAVLAMLDLLVDRKLERRELARIQDQHVAGQAVAEVLEKQISGTKVSWRNPETGSHGTVMPVQTWRTQSGRYCREFEETTTVESQTSVEYGIACRGEDGKWHVRIRYFPD